MVTSTERLPEAKTVKNRVHLDLQVGADRHDAEVQRLTDLGAIVAWVTADRGPVTTMMRDPDGSASGPWLVVARRHQDDVSSAVFRRPCTAHANVWHST
jgi:hypothetical protein